jgi:hypothetical protein
MNLIDTVPRYVSSDCRRWITQDIVTRGFGRDNLDSRLRVFLKLLHLACRHGTVERICSGHGTNQDEHDQTHALLAIVGTVEKADQRAGDDENAADPPWRRLIAMRFLIQ